MHKQATRIKSLCHNLERKLYVVLFVYTLFGLGAYLLSNSLIFEPPHPTYQDNSATLLNEPFDAKARFKIKTEDGALITAQHLELPGAKYTILYSHGNSEDLGMVEPILHAFNELGFSAMSYDYRGYGTSDGLANEGNTYRDVHAAYNYLTKTKGIAPTNIILFGRSLGSGPSTELASKAPIAGLILDSPYTSMFKIKTVIPLYPVDQFKNDQKIAQIEAPLLILHGTQDKVVPFWHGKNLYDLAKSPKFALWFEGGGHSNLIKTAKEAYFDSIVQFSKTLERQDNQPVERISFTQAGNP